MADKHLAGAEWKRFAKGRALKDADLRDALEGLEKAAKAPAAERLKACDGIAGASDALRKATRGDQEVAAYLDDLDDALKAARRAAEEAARVEAEEASPAQLTTRMVALLRDAARGQPMHAMIATAGRQTAVLLARKPISPPMRKVLAEYLGSPSGLKVALGQCLFEAKAHTFVLDAPAGGMAKRVRAALEVQTGLKVKVRVRGPAPDDVDDDDGADADGNAAVAEAPRDAPAQKPRKERDDAALPEDRDDEAPPRDPGDAAPRPGAIARAKAFNARLSGLQPAIRAALAGPAAATLKPLIARIAVAKGDVAAAEEALDAIAAALAADPAQAEAAAFDTLRDTLDPRLQHALRAAPDRRTALLGVWEYAVGQAKAGAFEKGLQALRRIAGTIDAILAAPARSAAEAHGIRAGLVAERRAELEQKIGGHVVAAKSGAAAGVLRMRGGLDGLITDPGGLVAAINASLASTLDEVQAALHGALAGGDAAAVTATIAAWRSRLASDRRFVELRRAAPMLGIDPAVDARFEELFERVTRDLAEATAS